MNISFQWNDVKTSQEQKAKVEENIRYEIPRTIKLKDGVGDLVVYLFGSPISSSLDGSVESSDGTHIAKVTYSLVPPCERRYFPLGSSYSDER